MNKRRVLCGMLAAVCCLALAACGGEKAVEVDAAALAQKLVGGLQFRDEMAQIDGAIAQQRYGVDEMIEVTMYRGSGATAEDILVIPINSSPKPIIILAISLADLRFPVSIITTPTITAIGASLAGLKNSAHSTADTSHPVTVVPILAPIITPIACVRFIMPAFTKPTTITVVADELWMTAVIAAPRSTPISLFLVRTSKMDFILFPAAFSSPWDIICIP